MDFWSKGLGERTIALSLARSESLKSEGTLCLRGRMEEPVSWEYIMRLTGDDLADFFALLKEPALADYLYRSPNRWRLYAGLIRGGLQLALLVLMAALRRAFARDTEEEEVVIQVPPRPERKRGRPVRRRLGSRTIAAPAPEPEVEESAEALSTTGRP
jgi:hypothetical protein